VYEKHQILNESVLLEELISSGVLFADAEEEKLNLIEENLALRKRLDQLEKILMEKRIRARRTEPIYSSKYNCLYFNYDYSIRSLFLKFILNSSEFFILFYMRLSAVF